MEKLLIFIKKHLLTIKINDICTLIFFQYLK